MRLITRSGATTTAISRSVLTSRQTNNIVKCYFIILTSSHWCYLIKDLTFWYVQVYCTLQSQVGLVNQVADGFAWTLLRCIHDDQKVHSAQWFALKAVCNTKLAVALTIMEECFVSMLDLRTGIHMIPQVLFNWGLVVLPMTIFPPLLCTSSFKCPNNTPSLMLYFKASTLGFCLVLICKALTSMWFSGLILLV